MPINRHILTIWMFLCIQFLHAQTAQFSLPQFSDCPGVNLTYALQASNLSNIGAITLHIGYDTAVLQYIGQSNVHPQFPGLITHAVVTPATQVNLSWSSMTPGNLENGTLVELNFLFKGGNCPLVFKPGGEVVTVDLVNVVFTTINGGVTDNPPFILAHPQDEIAMEGFDAHFSVDVDQVDLYQWQEWDGEEWSDLQNGADYQQVNGLSLTILGVENSMNGFRYRCHVINEQYCDKYSRAATLTVVPEINATLSIDQITICQDQIAAFPLSATGLNQITEMGIYILFDPELTTFSGISNIHPMLTGLTATILNSPTNCLYISWESSEAINIPDGSIVTLNFEANEGNATLTFGEQTYIRHISTLDYLLTTTNGNLITDLPPKITEQAYDYAVVEGLDAYFSIIATNVDSYQWFESQDNGDNWILLQNNSNYSGVNTQELKISNTPASFDHFQYKCQLESGSCSLFSDEAILFVVPPSTALISLDDVFSCPQNEVTVPVQGYFLVGLQEFTLNVAYNPLNTVFTGISNLNPQLGQMTVQVFNEPEAYIQFYWVSDSPVDIVDGIQFDLHFDFIAETTNLDFISGSYVLSEIETLETVFQNGSIIQNIQPEILNQPIDQTIEEGGEGEFSLTDQNGVQYQWFVSSDFGISWNNIINNGQYFGAQSLVLQMNNVPAEWNDNEYYCQISSFDCFVNSDTVTLLVDTLVGMNEVIREIAKPMSMNFSSLTSENILIETEVSNIGTLYIRVLDVFGKPLNEENYSFVNKGKHLINIPNSWNKHGLIIILGYFQDNDGLVSKDFIKLMK